MSRSGRFDFEEHLLSDIHDLPPLARLVGMTLATFADGWSCDLGKHSPSFEVLRKRAGISKSSVACPLDQLEAVGWVTRHRPAVADARLKHARTRYRLAVRRASGRPWPPRRLVPHGDLASPTVGLTTTETTVTTTGGQLDRHEIALKVAEGLAKKPGNDDHLGRPLTYSVWKHIWAGLGTGYKTHDLRHYAASALIAGGARSNRCR